MSKVTAFLAMLKAKAVLIGVISVVVVGGFFMFSGGGPEGEKTLVIAPGEFVQQVSVSGKVVAAQEVDLGFAQGGRVARVYASVGQRVAAGATLAETDNGDLRANVLQREAAVEAQLAKLDSIKQGTRPEEIAVAESAVASDQQSLEQANQSLLNELREVYTLSDDAIRNKLDQFISNPRTMNPKLMFEVSDGQIAISIESARPHMEKTLNDWQAEVNRLTSADDLTAALSRSQANLASVASLLSQASAALKRAITTQVFTQATIDSYATSIASARASVDAEIAAVTTAVTAVKHAKADLDASQKNLALKKAGNIQADVDAQSANVKAAQADLDNARSQLAKTIIRAPFSGVISKMDLKAGAIASANTPEVSMVSTGVYQIESFIPEVNVAIIEVGDTASVTLDAYGTDETFAAKVVAIDPAETVRDGVATYRSTLQFSASDARIKPGMTANVQITTDTRSDIISVPQGIVTDKAGKKYVRVKDGEGSVDREVTLGAVSGLGNVEIITGLRTGDIVVLETGE